MSVQELQRYIYSSKYARWNQTAGRRETYPEAVDRVFDMHSRKYSGLGVDTEIAEAKQAAIEQLVLGSQRALQFGGQPIEKKNARIYNCSASYCDRPRFFQEALWMLLCGTGVGFSVQRHHVAKLPAVMRPTGTPVTYVIPDSIEGWADGLGVLLSSYFTTSQPFPEFAGHPVELDYSAIRPLGAPISSGAGVAPGPEPLKRSLEKIQDLLEAITGHSETPIQLSPIQAYDIIMHASDAVLAGGVRRSATIALFSPDDHEMATAKTGDWFLTNPQRGRSNNSALLLRGSTDWETFSGLMGSVKEFGEPGFVWADSTELMVNPCVEIGMLPCIPRDVFEHLTYGTTRHTYPAALELLSGWQMCNLTEINAKACRTPEIFLRACRAAAIIGTLQAGYTDFTYLGAVSEAITRREALLGCSMTGMNDNPKIAFDAALQRQGAQLILYVNAGLADRMGIERCARATCVKPSGTTSCLLGTASGIHPHHAKRYLRRVQANKLDAPMQYFAAHNPRAVENSVWNPNGTDAVITFCVEAPEAAMVKRDVDAVTLLGLVKLTQDNWVTGGRRTENCAAPWLNHNVSNTVTVKPDEWEAVARFIYEHREAFAGVSLLPHSGDLDYPQAPFCAIYTYGEILAEYGVGAMFSSGLIVDGLHAFNDDLWAACSCAIGTGTSPESQTDLQRDWCRRASKFATNYFQGDVRKAVHCLKRVSLLKVWEDLNREFVAVDYTLMPEDSDQTKPMETIACSGGTCAL